MLVVIYLSIYLPIHLSIYLSICLAAICKLENEAILRDFLNFWTWQHQKTQQVCETSSIFELDNVKKEAILRDFLTFSSWQHQTKQLCETSFENGKVNAELTASCQCVLGFFSFHLSKVLRLPGKSDARSYEVLHLSRKIIFPKLRSDTPKCSFSQEFSALTS